MFIKRSMKKKLEDAASGLPVIGILGPRQSGKTTLAREVFKHHRYFSLELPSVLDAITADPQGFLEENKNPHGIILDEFQNMPQLLSYIQVYVDENPQPGYFVLTGSQNFLMNQAITQSLAGRISLFTLLPLSIQELKEANLLPEKSSTCLFTGFYPRLFAAHKENPNFLYNNYLQTYLERDVRLLQNVVNLLDFKRFMGLCAGRIGQLLNITELANDCGIDQKTAKAWLSVLEASYIIHLMPPYFRNNFGKRLVKMPKLYFYDTGLACSLLNITTEEQLLTHYLRGGLFESMIISDLIKHFYNNRYNPPLYFWRDSHGNEIDCIIEQGSKLIPVEIKSSMTITSNYFKGFEYWKDLIGADFQGGYIIYGGSETQRRHENRVIGWQSTDKIFEQ